MDPNPIFFSRYIFAQKLIKTQKKILPVFYEQELERTKLVKLNLLEFDLKSSIFVKKCVKKSCSVRRTLNFYFYDFFIGYL